MYKSAISYILPLLLGYLIVDIIWKTTSMRQRVLKLFLGIGIGLGVTSLLLFVWLWLTNQLKGFEWLLIGIILCILLMEIYRHRNEPFRFHLPTIRLPSSRLDIIFSAIFIIAFLFSYSSFITYSLDHQHGDRDAQAIWNLHARIIYRDPANWKEVFSPEFDTRFHPDYPLLTPLDVIWGWDFLKTETTRVPIVLAGLFTFGIVGLLSASLIHLKTWGQAALASLVLMGTPYFILLGTFQTADIPFAYFVLSTIVMFALYFVEKKPELLLLAGLTSGLAAWTKNEGILFILSSLVGCIIYGTMQRQLWKKLRYFLPGLLIPAIIIISYKVFLAPTNDLFLGFSTTVFIGKLISLQRYETIFTTIGINLLDFGNWPISIPILLLAFLIIIGFQMNNPSKRIIGVGIIILTVQLIGYIFMYVITPLPLEFHLQYSLGRLLFHLFPSALFLFFWAIDSPENVIRHLTSITRVHEQNASCD